MNTKTACVFAMITILSSLALSAADEKKPAQPAKKDPKVESIWPNWGYDLPDRKHKIIGQHQHKYAVQHDRPSIQVFRPEGKPENRPAVLIFPGGGYQILCDSYEGKLIAKFLNERGIVGVIVRYRTAPYNHPVELNDARRAYRFVRANAVKYGIDPKKIGVIGFSAGGHLAGTLMTALDAGDATSEDAVQREPIDIAFGALIYPVVTMQDKVTHRGSCQNLLGKEPTQEQKDEVSVELRVNQDTPPTFVAHSAKDNAVPVENSRRFVAAMKKFNRPVEYLELPEGDHGLGCGKGPQWEAWITAYGAWLDKNGYSVK